MKTDRFYAVLLLAMIAGFFFSAPVFADIFDDFSNSTLSGYVIDGEAKAIIENITIYEPEDEQLFGIPLKFARYKIVSFDGKDMVGDLLLIGKVGQSDTFYLSYRKLEEPFAVHAGGVLYNVTQHWNEKLPPLLIGAYVQDSGKMLYTIYGEYVIADGYTIGVDGVLGMESTWNRDFLEGKIWGKHNFDPEGRTFGEIFVYNISGKTYIGGGIGFKL